MPSFMKAMKDRMTEEEYEKAFGKVAEVPEGLRAMLKLVYPIDKQYKPIKYSEAVRTMLPPHQRPTEGSSSASFYATLKECPAHIQAVYKHWIDEVHGGRLAQDPYWWFTECLVEYHSVVLRYD